jgi:hypothetical protein
VEIIKSDRLAAASILQAPRFRSDVTVFRLPGTATAENWLRACISAEYGGTRIDDRGGS